MNRCTAVCVAICLACGYAERSTMATDWPTYRASAARDGYTPDAIPENIELRWVYRTGHVPQPAWPSSARMHFDRAYQPIIAGNLVIFGSSASDKVVALDLQTGVPRWSFFTAAPVRFAPVACRDRVLVAGDDGYLYALSLTDGRLLWKHRGGPNERMGLGNGRMISRWPARGGPVVLDDVVYYAAGIWPSDGVHLHALNAETGEPVWSNHESGGLEMPQPHGGANAKSGVAPQGYLLASADRLFVPTGRSVPAAFDRKSGELDHYLLQENGSIGGARAMVADRFVLNGGCFLERQSGKLAARCGRGVLSATPDGIVQLTGATLLARRWADLQSSDRKGNPVQYRGLEEIAQVDLGQDAEDPAKLADLFRQVPAVENLYKTDVRFKEVDEAVSKETGQERLLSQARPDVESSGLDADRFLAAAYEKTNEVIVAKDDAVCGGPGIVRIVNLPRQEIRWSRAVEGAALGLAVSDGRLIVSTTQGLVYCFADANLEPAAGPKPTKTDETAPASLTDDVDYARAAQEILEKSGAGEGYCVDLGGGNGRLALELAKRSKLHVYVIEADESRVEVARKMLDAAGLYGTRVAVHQADPADPPYPNYFAALIVSSASLTGAACAASREEIARMQRPLGGVVCLGKPGRMEIDVRGPLDNTGSWTHQNADAANTICSSDRRIKGPLEMLWFRDGPIEISDRHAQAPAPLVNRGVLVTLGVHAVCGLDAYNGRTLWEYPLPNVLADQDGVHHDVGVGDTGGNFCLSDDSVYVRTDDKCLRLDLKTGERLGEFHTPVSPEAEDHNWGYIAYHNGTLLGTVANALHTVSPRYENIRLRNESVRLFALDAVTGRLKWQYQPADSIRHNAIAVAEGRVYLIDRALALEDRIDRPEPLGKHRALLQPGQHPGGVLLALDAATGKVLWRQDDNIWGTQLAVSRKHGLVLMYYQAVKHSFFKLPSEIGGRMAAFDSASGARVWDVEAVFRTRPIINGDLIYAEPGAWSVKTGQPVPWEFTRSYGCGQIASSTYLMLFRSATLGYLDLSRDAGTENFGGVRTSCWYNAIPAAGLVLVPDGSSKCACSYQMQAWFALQQRQ
jgi:outer membrane protein assembly factor BamB